MRRGGSGPPLRGAFRCALSISGGGWHCPCAFRSSAEKDRWCLLSISGGGWHCPCALRPSLPRRGVWAANVRFAMFRGRPPARRAPDMRSLSSSRPAGTGRISDAGLAMSEGGHPAIDIRSLARSAAGPWPARSRAFCGRFPNVKPPRRTKCVGAASDASVGRAGRGPKPPAVRSVPRDYFVVLRASSQAASGILAMRATWRSPSNGVAMNSSRNSRAWSLVMKRAGSTSTLASLC